MTSASGTRVGVPPGTAGRPEPARRPRWSRPLVTTLLALAVVLVAAAAAYGVAAISDPRYGARAQLLYEVGDAVASEPRAERLLATQVVLLQSRAVLGPVAAQAGIRPEVLAERVDVELLRDSQVIELTVSDRDPDRALVMAGQILDGYAAAAPPAGDPAAAGQIRFLRAELEELSVEQAAVEEQLAELAADRDPDEPPSADERRLGLELETLQRRLADREGRLIAIELEDAAGPAARVLSPPYLLDEPLSPRPLQVVAAGVLVGLVLAAGLLLVAYRRGLTAGP